MREICGIRSRLGLNHRGRSVWSGSEVILRCSYLIQDQKCFTSDGLPSEVPQLLLSSFFCVPHARASSLEEKAVGCSRSVGPRRARCCYGLRLFSTVTAFSLPHSAP